MFLASLKQSTKLTLLISVLVILVVLSYLFYVFIIRRNRQRKIARDLEKKYHHIHEILSDDIIEKSIERVHNISLVNEDYVSYYEKFAMMMNTTSVMIKVKELILLFNTWKK